MSDPALTEIMLEFYEKEAAAIYKAKKDQANMVAVYTARIANLKPTPTVAEMNLVAAGNAPASIASSSISAATVVRPASAQLTFQRKVPRQS